MTIQRSTTFQVGRLIVACAAMLALVVGCGGAGTKTPDTYVVSGAITDSSSAGIEGVVVSFSGAPINVDPVTTNAEGEWERTELSGTVTVTPMHDGYLFDPLTATVDEARTNVDFTGVAIYAVSGTIVDEDDDPVPGVEVSFAGAQTIVAVTTDEVGHWEKAGLWGDVTVSADDPAYTFVSATRTVSAAAADVNFDGLMNTCNAGDRTDPIDPCVITRVKQVQKIQEKLDGHYALGADVDASSTESWSGGAGFEPLGSQATTVFTGSLDGRNFEIRGLFIDRESADEVGLFGHIGSGGEVSNLGLAAGSVRGHEYVGAIAGISHGAITSSYNSGSVTGDRHVGGVVGSNYASIEDASNTGDVGGGVRLGGLAGANQGSINNSFNAGDIVGEQRLGGIAGLSYSATIERSHNSGRIDGDNTVGGIVGSQEGAGSLMSTSYNRGAVVSRGTGGGLASEVWNGTIEDSYNLGAVTGSVRAGGVVGLLYDDGASTVRRTFNAGVVQGATEAGGVVGTLIAGVIDDSYFDEEASPGMGDEASYGRSSAAMMQQSTFAPAWNFGTVWTIDDGNDYPDLSDNPR